MQTKIKSSETGGDAESGLVIERRFTSAGQDMMPTLLHPPCLSHRPDGDLE